MSKILEKIVYSRLWEHIEHAPLSVCQWGFLKHRSTTTALLFATHEWYTYLKQKDVICILFDYRTAFDSVRHRRLMDKLSQIGFHPLILAWICSHLSNREQVVLVNSDSSQPIAVRSRVPQGSVLGPLLFLLYIDDITKLILFKNTRLVLYADDMLLYKPISSHLSYVEIQQDIHQLSQWTDLNTLSFNTTKCKCMLLSNKRNTFHPIVTLNNQPLEYVPQYKYLGVTVSQNLCWSHHIQHISCRARKILCIIYRNVAKNTDDPLTILRLYMSLVRPYLEYAAQVWNPHLVKDIHLPEKVQICFETL